MRYPLVRAALAITCLTGATAALAADSKLGRDIVTMFVSGSKLAMPDRSSIQKCR
jgi:hypothetical protein